jgi:predicted amidophosphoribosyltransferase
VSLTESTPEPAGFGNCRRCPYLQTGTAAICYRCARRTIEDVAPERCVTCDHPLPAGQELCGNPLCNRQSEERQWEFVWAIAMRTGALDRAIKAHKYAGKWGWSLIFGRVVVGYLDANRDTFEDFDVIIPSPTYTGPHGDSYDHTGEIIGRAELEDDSWPFRRDVMRKTRATPRLAQVAGGFPARALVAETEIAPALQVSRPEAVRGKLVLVFDDVFTSGLTLREVARKLRQAGAQAVYGIVLARSRFKGKP